MVAGPSASAALNWDTFELRLIDLNGAGAPTLSTPLLMIDVSSAWAGSSAAAVAPDCWPWEGNAGSASRTFRGNKKAWSSPFTFR
jgi:hypothetical protein